MPAQHLPRWVDSFLIYVVFAVAMCAAVDWLMGKAGRKKLQATMEDWWLRLEYVNWRTFGAAEARFADDVLVRFYGRRLFSFTRFGSAFQTVGIVTTLIAGSGLLMYHLGLGMRPTLDLWKFVEIALSQTLLFAVSVSMTRLLMLPLRWSPSSETLRLLIFCMMVAISIYVFVLWPGVLHALVTLASTYGRYEYLAWIGRVCECAPFSEVVLNTLQFLFLSFIAVGRFDVALLFSIFDSWFKHFMGILSANPIEVHEAVFVTMSMLPTLMRLLLAVVFLASAVLRRLIKPIMSTLLLRFTEAEQGVLTVVGIGLGGIAKMVQEAAKMGWL